MIDQNLIDSLIKDLEQYKISLDDIESATTYLSHYGYIGNEANLTKEAFEVAVKGFQEIFDIEKDGKIGPETLMAMAQPRCAVKDFLPLTEFVSWRKDTLTYYINGYVGFLDKNVQAQIIRQAWNHWQDVTDIHVEQSNSTSADIIIGVGSGSRDNFDGPSGTLAWAELPSGKDRQLTMKFDLGENWVDNPRKGGILMLNVATHEFGHILGLDHSKNSGALMAPYYSPNINKPQQNDDIPRIQAYYGKPVTKPDIPSPSPPIPVPVPTPSPVPSPDNTKLVLELEGKFDINKISIPGYRLTKLD